MQKYLFGIGLLISVSIASPAQAAHTFERAFESGLYRGNPDHVLSIPYQRVRRNEAIFQNLQPRIYDDGVVRVVDNTRRNTTEYQRNRSPYGHSSVINARLIHENPRKTRYTNRYPHTRYTNQPYRKARFVHLPNTRRCDWVTHFNRYHDGVGWVDYERIVPECDKADGYVRYFARDPLGRGRYTPNSFNQYDSYYWSDGHQKFNTYGW